MFWVDIWKFKNHIEYEYKYAGKYGAKGEKREKRKKPTPEQVKLQNQWLREKKMRRVLAANFEEDDYWICLKYPKGTRKSLKEINDDMKKFMDNLRKDYRKCGSEMKLVIRKEIGKRGGIHIHIVANRIPGADTDVMIRNRWKPFGSCNFALLYEQGGFRDLAEYIVKQPDEEQQKELDKLPEEDRKALIKYSSTRNLVRPVPERRLYSNRTMRKMVQEGPKAQEGYYIDAESVVSGINQFTGMSYLHYTEYRIRPDTKRMEGG